MSEWYLLFHSYVASTVVHAVVKGVQDCAQLLTTPASGGERENLCATSMKQLEMMVLSLSGGRECKLCAMKPALAPDAVVVTHGKVATCSTTAPSGKQENNRAMKGFGTRVTLIEPFTTLSQAFMWGTCRSNLFFWSDPSYMATPS